MPARRRFGSVRRLPSGRWQARYWDAAGNRAGAPVTFATKGDAQRWLSAAETDMSRGEWHDPRLGDIPFGEWAERWVATKAPKLQPSTVDLYRYLLRRHIIPRFGAVAVGRITAVEVQAWLARLHGTDLSPNTVAKAYRVLSGVLDGAVDARLIARSPCTLKGAGTERHDEIQIATPNRWQPWPPPSGPAGRRSCSPPPTAACGGASWPRYADGTSTWGQHHAVTRKLAEVNGQLSFGPPKSPAGRRTIGIPSFVARSLAVHIDLYALPGADGLVFPSADGQPMRRSNFRRRVSEPATAEVGMRGFRVHGLRHTAATLAAASGTSLKALMARIGHASAAAALRYQHVIDGQDSDIVRYLERFGEEPPVPTRAHHDTSAPDSGGARGGHDRRSGDRSERPSTL